MVRSVPFSLKSRIEDEIDRLETEGILERVESSEWANISNDRQDYVPTIQ